MTSVFRRSSSLTTSPVLRQLQIERDRIQMKHTIGKGEWRTQLSFYTRVEGLEYVMYTHPNLVDVVNVLGQFGRVCQGILLDDETGNHRVIAIKTLKCKLGTF